jgi:hypothetical protein
MLALQRSGGFMLMNAIGLRRVGVVMARSSVASTSPIHFALAAAR